MYGSATAEHRQFPRVLQEPFPEDLNDGQTRPGTFGVSPSPPRNVGIVSLEFVVAFLVGIAIGGILFTHESKRIMQIASHDATAEISFLNMPKAEIAPLSK